MDGINKYDLFSWRPDKSPRSRRLSTRQGLPYLMTNMPTRAGDGRGLTVQNIQASDLRTLRTRIIPDQTRAAHAKSKSIYIYDALSQTTNALGDVLVRRDSGAWCNSDIYITCMCGHFLEASIPSN